MEISPAGGDGRPARNSGRATEPHVIIQKTVLMWGPLLEIRGIKFAGPT